MSAATDTERVPRLADDKWRVWVATGVAMPISFAVTMGYAVYLLRADRAFSQGSATLVSGLAVEIALFLLYPALTWRVFARLGPDRLASWVSATSPRTRRARRIETWLGFGPKSWSVTAAALGLLAVLLVALSEDLRSQIPLVVLSLLTVASGWTVIVFAYALRYLRQHVEEPGLVFPGRPELVWRDYFYLAVQVSTTFSTSDVEVTTTAMRGTVTAQSIVAFVYNTVIVALLVSALLTFT